nr:hypothetical protein P9270_030675 [Mesorhizobium sp. WSM4875]
MQKRQRAKGPSRLSEPKIAICENTGERRPYSFCCVAVAITLLNESFAQIGSIAVNAKRRWEVMGKPDYLSAAAVDELKEVSELRSEPFVTSREGDSLRLTISTPAQSVTVIHFLHS